MGIYDSSLTRVQPVFNALYELDKTGLKWLDPLLMLGTRATAGVLNNGCGELEMSPHFELPVDPPKAFLRWLLEHPHLLSRPSEKQWNNWSPHTQQKRQALLDGDAAIQTEAITKLECDSRLPNPAWWRLEGVTRVDCAIETKTAVVFVEGKRTESGASSDVLWYQHRNQVLRLLDCAAEYARQKRKQQFFVLLVVEKALVEQDQKRQREIAKILSPETIEKSLPHLTGQERTTLLTHYRGATTWEDIVTRFGLSHKELFK